ncbi:hypothetical protein [Allomesorhizobium camelthorni]|nr:hypothetical protein [Mesorhizobium camelthorni]
MERAVMLDPHLVPARNGVLLESVRIAVGTRSKRAGVLSERRTR